MKTALPRVVIVGRMNVGKSTLFNRLSEDVKSLAFDYEGVTRDFLKDTVSWNGKSFELIDTGGIGIRKSRDSIAEQARQVVFTLLQSSDVLLFVVDGKAGVLSEDQELASMLRKLNKPVVLVINKIDTKRAQEQQYEFEQLGIGQSVTLSAQHGSGIADLLEMIVDTLPEHTKRVDESEAICKIVILGKPNVGKSSLLNTLLKEERAIVANIPGTTREAITEKIRFFKEDIQVTDTPGLRRQRGIKEPLEGLMVKSALRALQDADIVLLMIDASEGKVADQELKLAFYAFQELHKGLIILFNKSDIVDEFAHETMAYNLEEYQHLMKKVERLDISCKTGKNIGKIMPLVSEVARRYTDDIPVDNLGILIKEALFKKPLYRRSELVRLYDAEQVAHRPPTIALFVPVPEQWGPTQIGYLENQVRASCNLKGVPVRFVVRKRY
jgi:GTP-binding protein